MFGHFCFSKVSPISKSYLGNGESEWLQIPGDCWVECDQTGGLCQACKNYESNAISGYCCSGVNHQNGGGPILNGDCPHEAIVNQNSTSHSCVVLMNRGKENGVFQLLTSLSEMSNLSYVT